MESSVLSLFGDKYMPRENGRGNIDAVFPKDKREL